MKHHFGFRANATALFTATVLAAITSGGSVRAAGTPTPVPIEILQNGSFTNGFAGWVQTGSPTVTFLLTTNPDSSVTATVSNRSGISHTLAQNILVALTNGAGANGRIYTTRYRVLTAAPAATRCVLTLNSGGKMTKMILAERVIRTNGVWTDVRGTIAVAWSNTVSSASLAIEIGESWEQSFPAFSIADVRMQSDADADGLPDADEIATSPLSPDTDNDGLPDEWETQNGFDPAVTDESADDDDHDGFTNVQEYWAATDPRDALSFPGRPANPNLSAEACAVLRLLALMPSFPSNSIASGQHVSYPGLPLNEFTNFVVGLYTNTGYWPALVEFQYDDNANAMQIPVVNPLAISWWQSGGLVAIKFNPRNPWTGGPQSAPNPALNNGPVDLAGLLDPAAGAPANYATNLVAHDRYIAWLDEVAAGLAELKSNNVPVLYRTCAEMNGGWFWWGARSQADYIALWRHAFDYFTRVKGLNNLIWVYEGDSGTHVGAPSDYYFPGADVVDVAGHNLYNDSWTLAFNSNQLYRDYGKVYAFPQAGPKPQRDGSWINTLYAEAITARFPRASWFGVWNSFTSGTNGYQNVAIVDNTDALGLMEHPAIMSRDEVDWQAQFKPMDVRINSRSGGGEVLWHGGVLQTSANLKDWTDVDQPSWPMPVAAAGGSAMGFFRVRQ